MPDVNLPSVVMNNGNKSIFVSTNIEYREFSNLIDTRQ